MRHELLRLEAIVHGRGTLDGFHLELRAGEIVGVYSPHKAVGNTIVGLIAGRIAAASGRIYLDGEASPFEEADARRQRQVGVIDSARKLIDALSIAENIFVIRQGFKAGLIDMPLLKLQTRQLIADFGLTLAPETQAGKLSALARCQIELLKAIALGARIVVLHDLSSFLADFEIVRLLELVQRIKPRGIGCVLVDSSPHCLSTYAERVIVVNNGRNHWTFGRGELSEAALALCYSRARAPVPADAPAATTAQVPDDAPPALAFRDVRTAALDALSFALAPGEELCILDPRGRAIDEIRQLLTGEVCPRAGAGHITVGGRPYTAANSWQALAQRVAFVSENPAETMIFRDLTALDNLCLPASRKARGFWLKPAYRASCEREYAGYFASGSLRKYPDQLSAQERHTLVYCRWHLFRPAVVVCIRPYSSVDKTLEEISARFIGVLRQKGIAVLILTSNAAEAERVGRKITLDQKKAPHQPKIAL